MSLRCLSVLLFTTVLVGCKRVPYTDRRQLNMVPESFMNDLSMQAYRDMRKEGTIISSGDSVTRMRRIADNISAVTNRDDFRWRTTLFDDDEMVNAWCMPGGKIGFYTGILPVLRNDAGMAFVMGHEVAHAVLRHGSERMSQQIVALGGLAAVGLYVTNRTEVEDTQAAMILAVLGLGTQVGVMLPFSRMHESEADRVGLMFMARAGYPPEESLKVWNRMERESGGLNIEFLSTHPSYDSRRSDLRALMTRANTRYDKNRHKLSGQNPLEAVWR
jgi:predicted Zn-dependent protease